MSIVRDLPGIRFVRPLGRDPHRESWLVRLEGHPPAPAVLVRARDAHGARIVRVEAAALHRGRGPGLAALVDVVDDPDGAAVVRAHCVGPRLTTMLGEREQWDAGEVVTVLRPVAEAIARLHSSGVAHGALTACEIVVTATGGMLVELGAAELFPPDSPEAVLVRRDAVGRDRDAMRTLAVDMLRRVAGSRSRAARALADTLEQADAGGLLDVLRAGLADLAAPVAVARRDVPSAGASASVEATRLMPVVRNHAADTPAAPAVDGRGWRDAAMSRLGALRGRLAALPAARRRLLVAGGVAITTAAVLLALPSGADRGGPHLQREREHPAATENATTPATAASLTAADAAIAGEDPLAAVIALLERRTSCFSELSLLCLEGVDQQGSAALTSDRAAIQALREGEEASQVWVEPVDARLVERLGASALVEVGPQTAPASLLLMRSEAGWRIRDWVAGEGID